MTTFREASDREVSLLAAGDLLRDFMVQKGSLTPHQRRLARRSESPLDEAITQVQDHAAVNPHLPIAWPHWPAGIRPKIVAAAQKLTRRLLAWYINPIVAQQNTYNFSVVQALQESQRANARLATRLAELESKHRALTEAIAQGTRPAGAEHLRRPQNGR